MPPPPTPNDDPSSSMPPSLAGPSSTSTDTHSLYTSISLPLIFGSNIGPAGVRDVNAACRRCIKPWDQRMDMSTWTESGDGSDDSTSGNTTMVINIPFSVPVRISSILINQGVGEFAPRRLRAYINRPNGIDIDEVRDAQGVDATQPSTGSPSSGLPQADFLLREQDTNPTSSDERIQDYALGRFAPRFASVNSISIVLSGDAASLRVFYLNFRGTPPKETPRADDRIRTFAEDAASHPISKVKESARGSVAGLSGSAADGTGGQAR